MILFYHVIVLTRNSMARPFSPNRTSGISAQNVQVDVNNIIGSRIIVWRAPFSVIPHTAVIDYVTTRHTERKHSHLSRVS